MNIMDKLKFKNNILYNTKYIPFPGYNAIMLFGIVFTHDDIKEFDSREIHHERIHVLQWGNMMKLGIIIGAILAYISGYILPFIALPFLMYYIWYLVEYIIRLLFTFNFSKAYKGIKFEKEAYALDDEGFYQEDKRSHISMFSFLRY